LPPQLIYRGFVSTLFDYLPKLMNLLDTPIVKHISLDGKFTSLYSPEAVNRGHFQCLHMAVFQSLTCQDRAEGI
jgi:hypothetical protein